MTAEPISATPAAPPAGPSARVRTEYVEESQTTWVSLRVRLARTARAARAAIARAWTAVRGAVTPAGWLVVLWAVLGLVLGLALG